MYIQSYLTQSISKGVIFRLFSIRLKKYKCKLYLNIIWKSARKIFYSRYSRWAPLGIQMYTYTRTNIYIYVCLSIGQWTSPRRIADSAPLYSRAYIKTDSHSVVRVTTFISPILFELIYFGYPHIGNFSNISCNLRKFYRWRGWVILYLGCEHRYFIFQCHPIM